MENYQSEPVEYVRDALKMTLTEDQRRILESVRDHRRTAVLACHAVGKTVVAAMAANWWYDAWPDGHIAYITAPTWHQARDKTFKHVKLQRAGPGRDNLPPTRILESGKVLDTDPVRKEIHYIQTLNAESGEGFQGEHSAPILVILEEAVGVPKYIWEASKGLMTDKRSRMLAIGNPTNEATEFGEACRKWESIIHINGLHHPNVEAELENKEGPFPGAVDLNFIDEMIRDECEEVDAHGADTFTFRNKIYLPNAVFQGRVLGQFPTQADEQVIPRGWLLNLPVLEFTDIPHIGCDVARFGSDRSAIATRIGPCLTELKEIRQMDVDAVAGAIIEAGERARDLYNANAHEAINIRQIPIKIDVTGGLGVGPAVMLKQQGYQVQEVNYAAEANDKEHYKNVRNEMYFVLRERARSKNLDLSRLPREMREKLIRELSTPKYRVDSAGRKEVEPKDKIKERLGASPDMAEAVIQAFYTPKRGSVTVIRR